MALGANLYEYCDGRPASRFDGLGLIAGIGYILVVIGLIVFILVVIGEVVIRRFVLGPGGTRGLPAGSGPDELKALGCCGGDAKCEAALIALFKQVSSARTMGGGYQPESKCFLWCEAFLKANYPNWKPGSGPIDTDGTGTVAITPLENSTPGGRTIVTQRSTIGTPIGSMTGHCYFKVTIKGKGGTCTAYFDLGRSTTQGNYGGGDNWFFEDADHFRDQMPIDTETGLRP